MKQIRFKNLSLKCKINFAYSAAFVLIFAAGGMILFSVMKHTIEKNIENELTNTTSAIVNMVNTSAKTAIKNYLRGIAEKNRDILQNIYSRYQQGEFTEHEAKAKAGEILLSQTVGKTGYIFIWNILKAPGSVILDMHPKIQGQDVAHVGFVQEGIKLKNGYMEYEWKNPDESLPRKKAMYLAYFEPWEWIVAVSSYCEEFRDMVNVSDFRENIISHRFGETGYPFVIDYYGTVIIHPYYEGENFYYQLDADGREFIAEMCAQKNGKIVYPWKNPGEKTAREKLTVFHDLPEFGWIVGSSVYLDELYQPLNMLRNLILFIGFAAMFVGFPLISLRISFYITDSLHKLMNNLASVSDRDFSVRMDVCSEDEIGQLAGYFNTYMEKLETFAMTIEESEKKYRSVFENAVEGIFQSVPGGGYLIVNPAFARIFGYDSPEDVLAAVKDVGKQMYVNPQDREELIRIIRENGRAEGFEVQLYRKDKRIIWVSVYARSVSDDKGNMLYYEGSFIDITSRKQAELELKKYQEDLEETVEKRTAELTAATEKIRESEEKFRSIFENAVEGIFQSTPDSRLLSANPALAEILGYDSADELIGSVKNIAQQLYANPDDRKTFREILSKKGKVVSYEVQQKRKDGSVIWISMSARVIRDAHGNVRYYEGSFVDITKRKHAEFELKRHQDHLEELVEKRTAELTAANEKIRESEEKYRSIFENAIEGIFQTTQGGRFQSANPAMASVLGYDSVDDLIQNVTNIGEQLYVTPECRKELFRLIKAQGIVIGFETQFYRKDKSKIWISLNTRPVCDENGELLYIEGMLEDISQRKETEAELRKYREHLEEMVEKRTAELTGANEKLKAEIAERMRIEEELRQAGDSLENIFQSSADAIGITDRHGRFIKTNRRGIELFGYERKEMEGMSAYEIYADKDRYREIAETLQKEGFVRRCEVVMRKKDGTEFPVETSVSMLKDGNGKIIGTMGVTRDMSDLKKALIDLETTNSKLNLEIEERKRIEAELTQANSYLENVLENSADAVGIVDRDGKIIRWNKTAEDLFGYAFAELKGKPASDMYPDRDERDRMLDRLKAQGFIKRYEISMKKKDGTVFPVEISTALLKNENQEVIGSVSAGRDLSELRKAYTKIEKTNRKLNREIEERERISAELRQTNAYLENVLENSADGIGLADIHGKMVSWNRAAEELYGYTSEEIRGTSFADRYSDKKALGKMLAELRENGFVKHYEILMRKKGGTDSPFEVSIALLKGPDGKNIGSICVARDLSELKKLLTETCIAREAAEEANQRITDSLNYAKMIQRSLLANLDVVKAYLPKSFFIWEPRDIVGGDIFYTESFEDGYIVAVIDCTGHGVPGAFMTMIAVSALRRIIKDEGCHDPAEILKRLNRIVRTTLQQDKDYALSDDGMDAGIARVTRTDIESPAFGFQTLDLTFAGAKIPLYYVVNDEITVIKGDRQSLGYRRSDVNFNYTNHRVHIETGMAFYMATDGFTDQMGGDQERRFGTSRFKKLLKTICGKPFEKQRTILVQAFEEHRGERERQDDMTVVGFGF